MKKTRVASEVETLEIPKAEFTAKVIQLLEGNKEIVKYLANR